MNIDTDFCSKFTAKPLIKLRMCNNSKLRQHPSEW